MAPRRGKQGNPQQDVARLPQGRTARELCHQRRRADYLKVHSKNVDLIKVPKGKEVGDRVIISHIGYYINKYNKKYRYYILSKDRGYDSVVNFWSNKGFDIYLNKTTDFAVNYIMKHMSSFNSNLSDKVLKDRTRNPQLVNKAIEDRLKSENVDVRSNIKKILINTKDKTTVANQLNIIYGETKGNYYYNKILDFISIRQAKKYRKKTLESACKT